MFPIDLSSDEVRWDSQCFQASERLVRQCLEQKEEEQQQYQRGRRSRSDPMSPPETAAKEAASPSPSSESPGPVFFEAKFTLAVRNDRHKTMESCIQQ